MKQPRIQGRFASREQIEKRRALHSQLRFEIVWSQFLEGFGMAGLVIVTVALIVLVMM